MGFIINYWSGLLNNKVVLDLLLSWMNTVFPVYVFVVCSRFTFKELAGEILDNRWLMLKILLVSGVLIPLATAGILKIMTVPLMLGGIMLIASTAPGDPFDLVEAHGKKGGLLMATVVMLLLVLLMPLTVPCWMSVFTKWFPLHLSVSPLGIFMAVAPKVIPPLLLAIVLHKLWPSVTEKLVKILHAYFKISCILLAIFFAPFAVGKILYTFTPAGWLAMFIVTTITIFTGYYLGDSGRKERISIALSLSLGNMAAVMFISFHCYPKMNLPDFLITVLGWVVLRWLIIWLWYFFLKFRLYKKGEALS
ncbi:MAG: hypothetical protein WCG31_05135 [Deltaproteobacteria bacterium]